MAEITNELLYDLLLQIEADLSDLARGTREIRSDIAAMHGHVNVVRQDLSVIRGMLERQTQRLERIDDRLAHSATPRTGIPMCQQPH